jgi:hypothetical protein
LFLFDIVRIIINIKTGKGFEVELINLEAGLIYGELSKDDSKGDLYLDTWLSAYSEQYVMKSGLQLPAGNLISSGLSMT